MPLETRYLSFRKSNGDAELRVYIHLKRLRFVSFPNSTLTHDEYLEHHILFCHVSTRALNHSYSNISMWTSHTSEGRIPEAFHGLFPQNPSVVLWSLREIRLCSLLLELQLWERILGSFMSKHTWILWADAWRLKYLPLFRWAVLEVYEISSGDLPRTA